MDGIPLWCDGVEIGEAALERQPPYTCLRVRMPRRAGIWCAWAVGDRGEVRIGVLEPKSHEAGITRRFSRQALAPAGTLRRVELRREDAWASAGDPALKTRAFLRQLPEKRPAALARQAGGVRYVAFPRVPDGPFPLPGLFCLARTARLEGREYWVFAFDDQERPVLGDEKTTLDREEKIR